MNDHEVAVSIDGQEPYKRSDIYPHLRYLEWNWNTTEVSEHDRAWWEFWKIDTKRKKGLLVVGRYLLEGLDDFVRIATSEGNPLDYKATILNAMESLYDTVIQDAKLPWWMRPFSGSLKILFINILASLLIDYIVKRYECGQFS
jgi:hypothetical protein